MTKTFLLGVGAQKCGTTWLHDYLSGLPGVNMGFAKEYHVLDSLEDHDPTEFRTRAIRQARQRLESEPFSFTDDASFWTRISFLADLENYYRYFDGLLGSGETILTGDVSPSYSRLTPELLRIVKSNFDQRGIRTRVVFLMRDPVERCWSLVRMARREDQSRRRNLRFQETELEQLLRTYKSPAQSVRTQYDVTIANLEMVFDPADIYLGFYETLFTEAEVRRLCDFLQVGFVAPDFGRELNVSKKSTDIPAEASARIVAHYASTYRYAMNRFSEPFIRKVWPNAQFL